MPYRVGIIGTGGIAHSHANACKAVSQTDLVAIADTSSDALNQFGQRFDVQNRYPDAEAMLESEELDVVIICTWGPSHAELGKLVAQTSNAQAILCEKPLCMKAGEAEEFAQVAADNNVLLAEALKFRHHPQHLRAREIVDSGAIGDVRGLRSTFSIFTHAGWRQPGRNWRFNRKRGGGCIYDLGCDCIHHARYIMNSEPKKVFAATQPGAEVEEAADLLLVFEGGLTAHVSASYNYASSQYVEIYGTRGMLRIDPAWNNEGQAVSLHVLEAEGRTIPYRFQPTDQFEHQLHHLCDCLRTGQPHRISPQDSVRQMRVLDAIYESARTGQATAVAGDGPEGDKAAKGESGGADEPAGEE